MTLRRLIGVLLSIQAAILCSHFGHGDASPMAVLLIEGFDHFTAAQMTSKGWSAAPSSMVAARFSPGQAVQLATNGSSNKLLPSTYTTLIVGVAFKPAAVTNSNYQFLRLLTSAGGVIAAARVNASGLIEIINGGGTVYGTGTTALTAGSWFYVELKIFVNGASGTCELHLNGVSEIASSVGNFGSTAIAQVQISSFNVGGSQIDDLYVCDTTGTDNNTFLGDRRVVTLYPTADGSHSQWTPTGGGTHYDQVNETTPDGDTTYVSDATPGDLDSYVFGDVDGAATVNALQINTYARKDDAPARQIAPLIRQGGVDYAGTAAVLSSSYGFQSQVYDKDPTGAAWTATHVNSDEYGVKEVA